MRRFGQGVLIFFACLGLIGVGVLAAKGISNVLPEDETQDVVETPEDTETEDKTEVEE